jgi:hypothetical protein
MPGQTGTAAKYNQQRKKTVIQNSHDSGAGMYIRVIPDNIGRAHT